MPACSRRRRRAAESMDCDMSFDKRGLEVSAAGYYEQPSRRVAPLSLVVCSESPIEIDVPFDHLIGREVSLEPCASITA